jgi:hypothetical protein
VREHRALVLVISSHVLGTAMFASLAVWARVKLGPEGLPPIPVLTLFADITREQFLKSNTNWYWTLDMNRTVDLAGHGPQGAVELLVHELQNLGITPARRATSS